MMTRDERLRELVKRYFRPEDYFLLRDRMIGSGAIGGKACGMLLARKIIETDVPEYAGYNEPHDPSTLAPMFSTLISYPTTAGSCGSASGQKTDIFPQPRSCRNICLRNLSRVDPGPFHQYRGIFRQSPFIVRSSSFLEDGFAMLSREI